MALELELVAARYRLGVLSGSDLVLAAEASLLAGTESESLARLAGETDPIMSDVAPLFERALGELSIELPNKDKACWDLLRHHMGRIANKEQNPRAGVRAILEEVYYPGGLYKQENEYVGDSHDLHRILGYFYGIDDIEARPHEVSCDGKYGAEAIETAEAHIRRLAEEWVREHGT